MDYESIADKMLKELEDQYEQVHKYDKENMEAQKVQENENQQDQQPLEGYEAIDMDDGEQQQQDNPQIKQNQQQLVEVQPVSEETFKVPETNFSIDSQKIKKISLNMDIKIPDWAKDESLCEQKLKNLFSQTKH